MADNYLNLDTYIQGNARALLTGEASGEDRFLVQTQGHKRMKRTRADGVPIWDDVVPIRDDALGDVVDITDHVHNAAAQLRREARS